MFINELFNRPLNYELIRNEPNLIKYTFSDVVNGVERKYIAGFRYMKGDGKKRTKKSLSNKVESKGGWEFYFDVDGFSSAGLTNFLNSQKIFATLVHIAMDFFSDNEDAIILFLAISPKKHKFYENLVKKLAQNYPIDYEIKPDDAIFVRVASEDDQNED